MKKKFVRQAIIQGINRAQIREVLYVKTGSGSEPKLIPVLQSNIFKPFEPRYATPYKRWKFSQKNVIALLKKNGCTGGPDAAEFAGTRRSSVVPAWASSRSSSRRRRATRSGP